MWGNCPTLANGAKIHVFSYLVYPNHLQLVISAGRWGKLWQLIVLGMGWQDCQSMPPRTLHPYLTSEWKGKTNITHTRGFSSSLHELLNTQALKFRVLLVVCSPTDKNGAAFPHAGPPLLFIPHRVRLFLTHRIFPGFSADAVSWVPCFFIHDWVWRAIPVFSCLIDYWSHT